MKRIIIIGKGGAGKTTIVSTVARLLARDGYRVLLIDCDPSMNLAMSLGVPLSDIRPLADEKKTIDRVLNQDIGNVIGEGAVVVIDHHTHEEVSYDQEVLPGPHNRGN